MLGFASYLTSTTHAIISNTHMRGCDLLDVDLL